MGGWVEGLSVRARFVFNFEGVWGIIDRVLLRLTLLVGEVGGDDTSDRVTSS